MGNLLHISLANDAIRCQKVLILSYQFNLEKNSVHGSDMSKIPYIGLSNKKLLTCLTNFLERLLS